MTKSKNKNISKHYTNYYLALLVLSIAFTMLAGALSLLTLPTIPAHFSAAPFYASIELVSTLSLILTATALVFLYQKRRIGLTLILIDCALGLVICFATALYVDQMVAVMLAEQQVDQSTTLALKATMPFLIYVAIIFQAIFYYVFALLWRNAWKKQSAADKSANSK